MLLTSVKKLGVIQNIRDNPLLMFNEESQKNIVMTTIKEIITNVDTFFLKISSIERLNFIFNAISIGFNLPLLSILDFERAEQCITIYRNLLKKSKIPIEFQKTPNIICSMLCDISLLFNKNNKSEMYYQQYNQICLKSLEVFEKGISVLIKNKELDEIKTVIILLIGMIKEMLEGFNSNNQLLYSNVIIKIFSLLSDCLIINDNKFEEWKIFKKEVIYLIEFNEIFEIWANYVIKIQQIIISSLYCKDFIKFKLMSFSKPEVIVISFKQLKDLWIQFLSCVDFKLIKTPKTLLHYCQICSRLIQEMKDLSIKFLKQNPLPKTIYTIYLKEFIKIIISNNQQEFNEVIYFIIPILGNFMEECLKNIQYNESIVNELIYCFKKCLESTEYNLLIITYSELINILKCHQNQLLLLFKPLINSIEKIILQNKLQTNKIILLLLNEMKYYYSFICHTQIFERIEINKKYCLILNTLLYNKYFTLNEYYLLFIITEHFIIESSIDEKLPQSNKIEIEQSTIPIHCFELLWKIFIVLKYGLLNKLILTNNEQTLLTIIRIFRYSSFYISFMVNKRCFIVGVINLFCELMPKILSLPSTLVFNSSMHLVIFFSTLLPSLQDKLFFKINDMFLSLSSSKSSFYAALLERFYTFFISYFFQLTTKTDIHFFDLFIQHQPIDKQMSISIKNDNAIYTIFENTLSSPNSFYIFGINTYNKLINKLIILNHHLQSTQIPIPINRFSYYPEGNEFETEMTQLFIQQLNINKPLIIQPNQSIENKKPFNKNSNLFKYSLLNICIQTLFSSSQILESPITSLSISSLPLTLYLSPIIPPRDSLYCKSFLHLYSSKQINLIKFPNQKLDIVFKTNEHVFGDVVVNFKRCNEQLYSIQLTSKIIIFVHYSSLIHFISNYLFESLIQQDYNKLFIDINTINTTLINLKTQCPSYEAILFPQILNSKQLPNSNSKTQKLLNDDETDWWGVLDQNLVMCRKGSSPLNITLLQTHSRKRSKSSPIDN
ncbi:hypothetical protein EHI8A_067020 [Entamoeba histolytica HM-1:IMSS-B]|uniref:Uncharacterized protein n=6 Tax=Entamoeba histolytica TaxID=5759 RepID=C4LUL2_ENTH1|nr:hypothetical protein EHI_022990 [Entamoeba histolytica HM-1:IMSS]EMD43971.1 Hypothetical protein EHI5A_100720 [Entamoeba histolytica KU27]EMH76877.1 hypothetical protein EHI8A_067020 [Entamoeba histolytica HM-1:IMSS-B]EMS11265.1 hypothetical protein KM1_122570 [Entamoeba histolytica HM-3:IMSS]ENY62517.1 hypothetical protein EHI7A_063490 [Entamoeba histolytica HM-1:IMSS-A]EAL48107.1 hypothetical protein EHI_022990 [Entamoeba histolytica HM-1:IMSS]|eukprot:XP_653493.1 hypothetical protein EHI_022990 [Entamoeba histolytica HM-1:IMSS]